VLGKWAGKKTKKLAQSEIWAAKVRRGKKKVGPSCDNTGCKAAEEEYLGLCIVAVGL